LQRERQKGMSQAVAAARAGMSERTARKYERLGKLPSQVRERRDYRTRPDPFREDWPWVQRALERDPALQAVTLFALLCAEHPGRYQEGQVRTLQRHMQLWRALHGPEQEVMFAQRHEPGEAAQSDFTHMTDLGVTLAGVPFAHMVFHMVLTYSNVEAITLCFSESFEALAEGIESCLWQLGGVPKAHRTDQLTAAVRRLDGEGQRDWNARYAALLAHYGMEPTTSQAGEAHQNGDVEQSHHRFKLAVDQALRVRGQRDFVDRPSYVRFLQELVTQRNHTRSTRFAAERAALRPLPALPLLPCREVRALVGQGSTMQVLGNGYSVPSRLIGTTLTVRVRAETLEAYVGTALAVTLPRLAGKGLVRIDYRHVVWSLVRKPGAFAAYRYREELFPTLLFRRAYDILQERCPARADREYVRVLHLAASTTEADVETALGLLLEAGTVPAFDAVRELVRQPQPSAVPALAMPAVTYGVYDQLLLSRSAHGG
jgi:transposase